MFPGKLSEPIQHVAKFAPLGLGRSHRLWLRFARRTVGIAVQRSGLPCGDVPIEYRKQFYRRRANVLNVDFVSWMRGPIAEGPY